MTEVREQMSEDRGQKTEVRGQMSEDREQTTEMRILNSESFNYELKLHFSKYALPYNLGLPAFKPPGLPAFISLTLLTPHACCLKPYTFCLQL